MKRVATLGVGFQTSCKMVSRGSSVPNMALVVASRRMASRRSASVFQVRVKYHPQAHKQASSGVATLGVGFKRRVLWFPWSHESYVGFPTTGVQRRFVSVLSCGFPRLMHAFLES
jgi:hypothetical protein